MNKILVSLCVIAVAAAIGIGATTAYFTSTQASIGNIITAGNLSLEVGSTCHYNGMICASNVWAADEDESTTVAEPSMIGTACSCTWIAKSLTPDNLFFNYDDVKPGDVGENTISLHINNNPAWVCASISNLEAKENGCANNAEMKDDEDCGTELTGELKNNLLFTVWRDSDCNNILDGQETAIVTEQPASELNWAIADSQNGGQPIPGSDDPSDKTCIGVRWTVPAEVENEIQGDSIQGDITFTAVQSRNNASFTCEPIEPVESGENPSF
jgi:predicted ribosomally synthesized peptide with SipW-like signal peptide